MKKEIFAILHDTKTTQLLVDQDYNHLGDEFSLTIKWWSFEINGFVTMSPKWSGDYKPDFKKVFEELKDIDYAIEYANSLMQQCGVKPELRKF